ncbi:MAG: STAS domain-containing protein [Dissulfurispiraceae bacterium]
MLDMEMVNKIDTTGADKMKTLVLKLRKKGREISLANVRTPVAEVL